MSRTSAAIAALREIAAKVPDRRHKTVNENSDTFPVVFYHFQPYTAWLQPKGGLLRDTNLSKRQRNEGRRERF